MKLYFNFAVPETLSSGFVVLFVEGNGMECHMSRYDLKALKELAKIVGPSVDFCVH
jgi:hypothetical protein